MSLERGRVVQFTYKNWRGETAERTVVVEGISHGCTEYHNIPCFFLNGFCLDKKARRSFFIGDIDAATFKVLG